jgi:hypothetical protein
LTTVFGEVTQETIHGADRRAINQVATLALLSDEPGMSQLFEMKGQRIGRDIQLIGKDSGREPINTGNNKGTEHTQAHTLGQGGERSDNIGFVHKSIIQR